MSQFASMYTSVDEIIVEGEDYGKTQLPLSYDRSCELAVECWQLRRELADRQVKQSDSEAFAAKLQKDINRLKNNADVQRLDIKEKEKTIFDLSNTVLDQNTRITNLEVSLNGVTGTLRRKNAELSAAAKKYKSLEDELSEYREKSDATARELAKENARAKKEITQKLAQTTRELAEMADKKAMLDAETGGQQQELVELRRRVAAFEKQVASMTPTVEHDAVCNELAATARERLELQEALTELQGEHSEAQVAAAELTENYNVIRTEFKLLLSQPQFKNIRVNNKISRLLNDAGAPRAEAPSAVNSPTAAGAKAK